MEALQARATTLRASLSPLVAAQQNFGKAVAGAGELLAAGAITEAEHTAAVGAARKALQEAEKAALSAGSGFHLSSMQAMELEHSARAMVDAMAAGQNPIRALVLELGRIGQVAGSGEGGIAGALTALKPIVLGPVGAIGALTVAVLAAGAAAQAYARDQSQLRLALDGAGRSTGAGLAQLNAYAEAGARAGDISVAQARQIEVAALRAGTVSKAVFQGLIEVQRNYAAATGQTAEAATNELVKAFADPAKGADTLNERLHFLNEAQLQYIRGLEEAGDRTGAARTLMDALSNSVHKAADDFTGLGRVFHEFKKDADDATDSVGRFFYRLTHKDTAGKIDDIDKEIGDFKILAQNPNEAGEAQRNIAQLLAQRRALEKQLPASADGNVTASQRVAAIVDRYDPSVAERLQKEEDAKFLRDQAAGGFQGVDAARANAARYLAGGLQRAADTTISPEQREVQEAQIRARLARREGAQDRGRDQAALAALQTAGQPLSASDAASVVASGQLRGENRGARVDQAGERRAEAEANRQEAAAKASDDIVSRAREAQDKAEETIATAKGDQVKAALVAAVSDTSLNEQERRARIAQAASDVGLQNAKGDRLRLELQRIEVDRRRQLNDVAKQRDFTPAEHSAAAAAINAASDSQARAARTQDQAKDATADAAASGLAGQFATAALKSQAGNVNLPLAQRLAAEERLLQLQQDEADERTRAVVSVKGVQDATAARARQEQAASQAAELVAAVSGQTRQYQQSDLESAKALTTTQAERNTIERDQLALAQQQRAAATQILLKQLATASFLDAAEKARLSGALTSAQGNLDASEQEALRRQQLSPTQRLYDPSQQASPHDLAQQDIADTSQRLSAAFVSLEQNTTTFGKAMRDVVTSLQGEVYKQITDRLMAPAYKFVDQGIDKLFPATASTGVSAAQTAMGQSASAATAAITALANAATEAATRLGLGGATGMAGLSLGGLGGTIPGANYAIDTSGLDSLPVLPPFAGGGLFRGAGTSTGDANLARISDGEYIVNARATAAHLPTLESLNSGRPPGFASGGYYGDDADRRRHMSAYRLAGAAAGGGGGGDVHLHNHTGQPMQATAQRGSNGDMTVKLTPLFDRAARARAGDPNGLARDLRLIPQTRKQRC